MKKTGARLVVKDVALSFGGIQALRSVSFQAAPSELVALVGPNGAGKTAMLNCINGIYHPRSGEILLDGERIAGHPLCKMVELGVGRAFQHAELFPHLTVIENLLIGRHRSFRAGAFMSGLYFGCARTEEGEARRRIEAIIDFFEIYRHRNTPVGMLSYGIQKIVGVARALATEPKLLLCLTNHRPGSSVKSVKIWHASYSASFTTSARPLCGSSTICRWSQTLPIAIFEPWFRTTTRKASREKLRIRRM
jgi:ABC-type branched-subunit amino acid transport system ATPase component